jgi:hypothetical protein
MSYSVLSSLTLLLHSVVVAVQLNVLPALLANAAQF